MKAVYYAITPSMWTEKEGDVYRCENIGCETYKGFFYTDVKEKLHEGYPYRK